MSAQSDIVLAFMGSPLPLAHERVYPEAAPQDAQRPFVVFRKVAADPLMTLQGYSGQTHYIFAFESWAATYLGAMQQADLIRVAIEASLALQPLYRQPTEPDGYEPAVDEFVETVLYSFWHS